MNPLPNRFEIDRLGRGCDHRQLAGQQKVAGEQRIDDAAAHHLMEGGRPLMGGGDIGDEFEYLGQGGGARAARGDREDQGLFLGGGDAAFHLGLRQRRGLTLDAPHANPRAQASQRVLDPALSRHTQGRNSG
jgi:hypothetical protein